MIVQIWNVYLDDDLVFSGKPIEIAEYLGIDYTTVLRACRQKRKLRSGHAIVKSLSKRQVYKYTIKNLDGKIVFIGRKEDTRAFLKCSYERLFDAYKNGAEIDGYLVSRELSTSEEIDKISSFYFPLFQKLIK